VYIYQGYQVVHGDGFYDEGKEGLFLIDLVGFKDSVFGDAARTRSYVIEKNHWKDKFFLLN